LREIGADLLTISDPGFPKSLREIPDAPILLSVWGSLRETDHHAIGVVGSRRTTTYGLTCAKRIAFQLARAGVVVVSGLARGIDTAAHEAAVASGGRTVAVLGSGLGQLYPPENRALAERIADGHGAVVSEFPVDYPPDKQSFPLRNRIVAGWGQGVLVVEAPRRSGALITAAQANDYGRSVFAVPGPIDRPTAEGTNALIQSGARLVTGAADILDDLSALLPAERSLDLPSPAVSEAPVAGLSEEEKAVYRALGESEVALDELVTTTGLTIPVVSTTLLRLQVKRLVKQLPGSYFVKLIRPY
jgi:DNA processing protein